MAASNEKILSLGRIGQYALLAFGRFGVNNLYA